MVTNRSNHQADQQARRKAKLLSRLKSTAIVTTAIVTTGIASLFFAHQFVSSKGDLIHRIAPAADLPEFRSLEAVTEQINEVIVSTRPTLSPQIESYSRRGNFTLAKDELLKRAVSAAGNQDSAALAHSLGELGELALQQGELGMAKVYLAEALETFQELGDDVNVAGIYVQIGRLHLYKRQRARQTSDAYDQLLISRWKISKGQFYEVTDQLIDVVQTNLDLHRYGAAASAYETLFNGYSANSNYIEAQQAGKDAIRLHATSGNLKAANRLLDEMIDTGLSLADSNEIVGQIDSYYQEYQASVQAIGEARDYALLYNQLSSRGDALQAWRFRQKAEQSLASVSSRARYRRQPDVLVELYTSNVSMIDAVQSLQKASALYTQYGVEEGVQRSQQLQEQIY